MLGLYIHIPFCMSICTYCDFPKRIPKSQEHIDLYLKELITELNSYNEYLERVDTIYIGGGTPTILSAEKLDSFLSHLPRKREITIEINPENFNLEKAIILKKHDINRVSIGVQTFNKKLLKTLGRNHTDNDVKESIKILKSQNITNINIDLIYGIPDMTLDDVKYDLERFLALEVPHISYYSLILEEKTILYYQYKQGLINLIDDDTQADMYEYIIKHLKNDGFHHYEISNFAKNGLESLHNQIYWKNQEYIGIGAGASGYLNNTRYTNNPIVSEYLIKHRLSEEKIDKNTRINDELMLGLRLIDGINIEDVNEKYNIDIFLYFPFINNLIKQNLLEIEDKRLKLTHQGIFLGNLVFEYFV